MVRKSWAVHAACGRNFDKSLDKHARDLGESWIRFGKVTAQTIDLVVDDLMMDCTMVHMRGWRDHHGRKGDRWDARWMWPNCATIEHVDGRSRWYG
jgi:hypothetical protein